MQKMTFFHRTTEERWESIKNDGLKPRANTNLTLGGNWSFDVYDGNPIFLGLTPDDLKSYASSSPVLLSVELFDDSDLMADLPALVDLGAFYDVDSDALWWKNEDDTPDLLKEFLDEQGILSLSNLTSPGSAEAYAAIQTTKTASIMSPIHHNLLTRIGTDWLLRP